MKTILIFILLLAIPGIALSVVFGGSNLSRITGYPTHNCYKPTKPYKPSSFSNQWEIDRYNNEVERYNFKLKDYINCMEEYIENCNNDIKRIQEKIEEAADEVKYGF